MIIVWGYDNVNQEQWLTYDPWTPAWDSSTGDGGTPPPPVAGRHTTGGLFWYRTTSPA